MVQPINIEIQAQLYVRVLLYMTSPGSRFSGAACEIQNQYIRPIKMNSLNYYHMVATHPFHAEVNPERLCYAAGWLTPTSNEQ